MTSKALRGLALLLSFAASAFAADFTLPAENQGWWTPGAASGTAGVGVPGGIEQYIAGGASDRAVSGTVRNVVTGHSADNTGASDATSAIQSAITAAASGDVVYLPAGTYRIDGTISIPYAKNNITFRGAGSQASGGTTIVANGTSTQSVMTVGTSNSWEGNTYQDITGTLTKGTTNLTIASSASFAVDGFVIIKLENENDDTRIQAGAAPTWSSGVFSAMRRFVHRVVAKPDATTVTIEPPLMVDATNHAPQIVHGDLVGFETRNVGVEGLRIIGGANAAHFKEGIAISRGIECWIYDVYFERAGSAGNGNCIKLYHGYRNEVRKCTFVSKATTFDNSDGAVQYQWQTSLLIEDNSFMREGTGTHGWNVGIYSDGYIHNSVHAFNSFDACNKNILIAHTGGPCMLNLYEGNIGQRLQHDGYFSSTSHNTLYRNWFSGRQIDGSSNPNGGYVSWFKRFSRNFALVGNVWGWDGNNAAGAGELQIGYPNTGNDSYTSTAQPTSGDFWADWAAYKAGTYTAGVSGFQELDLDAEPSFTITHNYMSSLTTGSVTNSTADTLPASMFRSAKPDYFGTLTWPAINPDAPEFSNTAIPSSYRYLNGNEDYLGPSVPSFSTQPSTQTATVGDNVTLTVAGGGNPAPTLQWRKGGVNISGATSSSLILSNVQLADTGSYDCVATNSEGTATSTAAVLTVNAAPSGVGNATVTTLNATTLNITP